MRCAYRPNDFARGKFCLPLDYYEGDGVTPTLRAAIGADNYSHWVFAQDPLCGTNDRKGPAEVFIRTEGPAFGAGSSVSIGTVEVVT